MSEHSMATPIYHQRSHSMPVGHAFINNNSMMTNGQNTRTFDFKRSADTSAQITTNEGFPLPIPKSVSSHFHTSEDKQLETEEVSFFRHPKTLLNIVDYHKKSCPVILNCKMDRGFFISQSHWTCYRRNYFQVTASFIVPGHTDQSCYALQLYPDKPIQPIQQFFLRLRACTSTTHTPPSPTDEPNTLESHASVVKPIALTQMTPKRDKGPQREPPVLPITPSDSAFSSEQVCVTFERLQFRVATANNGKRRASQQYFCLIFQLIAQLEDTTQHVVSECYSSPLVVRGRSPGHYSTEPPRDLRKKKKPMPVSPKQEMLPSPTTSVSQPTKPSSPSPTSPHYPMVTLPPPPPQYVFTPPPMILDARQNNEQDQSYQPMIPPTIMNSAFSQFHGRSQSANDSDFFTRNRVKYQRHDEGLFDDYHVGIQSALRNWQQQVARQRTDSATTFDSSSYMSSTSTHHEQRQTTRPNTPLPYNPGFSQPSMTNHWSPRQTHYVEETSPKLYHPQ